VADRPRVGIDRTCLAPHAIARWAIETPDAIAIQQIDGPNRTYADLDHEARCWATAATRIGVAPGTHVATMVPNGFIAFAAFLGLAWCRAREVPVNTATTGRLLHYILHNADVTILLVAHDFVDRLLALDDELPLLHTVVVVDSDDTAALVASRPLWRVLGIHQFLDGAEPATDLPGPVYRDIAAILYTSGTTGPSKGVLVPWSVIYQFWSWVPDETVPQGSGLYGPLPVVHNSGRSCLNYALVRGARFVFRERFSGSEYWNDVRRYDCITGALVGPMTQFLQSQPPRDDDRDNPLKHVICGPLIAEIDAFKERFGVVVATSYGMTEVGIVLGTEWNHGPWQNCGRPRSSYPWTETRIVDENDEPVATGEIGELVVRSAEPWALNAGYYEMPEKTAEAWRNGWFHTGDAFRTDEDGWYYLVDRMKDAIRRRGENISSFEVESIIDDHPDVLASAAVAVPAAMGEDEVLVVVEVRDPDNFDHAAFSAWFQPRLAKFMWPRYIDAVAALPRNENTARIKKYELRSRGITATTWDREAARPLDA
jgi:crotonobetaine/carnitine-CoA ligase